MDLPSNADAPGGPTPSPGSGSRPTGVAEANCSPVGIGWGAIEGGDHLCARLFDQASQPLVLFDLDRRITRVNRAFEALVGYPAAALVGRALDEITPPEWRSTTSDAARRLTKPFFTSAATESGFRSSGSPYPPPPWKV